MLVIGEGSQDIPQDLKDKFSFIQWNNIIGMRNNRSLDSEIVFKVVKNELGAYKVALIKMIELVPIMKTEFNNLLNSKHYANLGFLKK